ncbi:unnamed protein product [Mytilus edulis]|uniref:Uncharacterized protein n=1 Tax=Mytilus edulis TaxID=6550 RepID=A0A8S3VCS2_MYTED|nr:unnamed protein product [Mytilus edulis]
MERLSTFKCKNTPNGVIWNDDQTVKPEQLVSAGFSFDGIKDQVICKLCKCTSDVNKWDRNDDEYAFSVHKGLSKDCKFTIIYTSEISEKLSPNTYVKEDSIKSLKHYYDDNADKFKEDSIYLDLKFAVILLHADHTKVLKENNHEQEHDKKIPKTAVSYIRQNRWLGHNNPTLEELRYIVVVENSETDDESK